MNNNLSLLKIINGLSKTINTVNKMIPLYNQIKPIITNGSKLISNINLSATPKQNTLIKQEENPKQIKNNLPTFFQ